MKETRVVCCLEPFPQRSPSSTLRPGSKGTVGSLNPPSSMSWLVLFLFCFIPPSLRNSAEQLLFIKKKEEKKGWVTLLVHSFCTVTNSE